MNGAITSSKRFGISMYGSPDDYVEAAVLAKEAGDELLARLDWMTLQPKVIVDIGCGSGRMSSKLKERYPSSKVLAIDKAENMIGYAKQQTANHLLMFACADGQNIPLRDHTVDLLFVNFLFPWLHDQNRVLREWQRILKPNGLLLLTALGPNTLKEWREIWDHALIPQLFDMHDIGDILSQQGFDDPVLEVNDYTVTYQHAEKFISELLITAILDPQLLQLDLNLILEKKLSATFEVIFAHAFMPLEIGYQTSDNSLTKIPLSHVRHALNKNK